MDWIQVRHLAVVSALVPYVCFAIALQHFWHRCPSTKKGAKAESHHVQRGEQGVY